MASRTANLRLIKPDDGEAFDIANENANMDTLDEEVASRIKKVNGEGPDSDGNLNLKTVPYAENLETNMSQASAGVFELRTTGGDASLSDGDAWLTLIRGHRVHNGYSAESLVMTVTPAERGEGDAPIMAEVDRDDFVAAVSGVSGTYTFTYTGSWNTNPANYGITVTGTPISGDEISVVFAAEVRGTIIQSNPQTFVSTGWNLYNHAVGYARVKKYSPDMGYMIAGAYTALQFSATLDGAKTSLVAEDGIITITQDGYIWVTGGNTTTTQIWATWSDWTTQALCNGGVFEAYEQTVVDISAFMALRFPNGLMAVGSYADELNLNIGIATSWVQRMSYSAENLATAEATGRDYEYDENYIYLAKAAADIYEIKVESGGQTTYFPGDYTANDHGLEYFTGTAVGVYAQNLYGCNLKNRLERDVLTISQQTLDNSQKTQARTNIGAASAAEVSSLSDQIANLIHNVESGGTIQTSTSYAYTGKSVTIPAKSYFFVRARCAYVNSMPTGTVISRSSDPNATYDKAAGGDNVGHTSYCGYTPSSMTLYLIAKYGSAASNHVELSGGYITVA